MIKEMFDDLRHFSFKSGFEFLNRQYSNRTIPFIDGILPTSIFSGVMQWCHTLKMCTFI